MTLILSVTTAFYLGSLYMFYRYIKNKLQEYANTTSDAFNTESDISINDFVYSIVNNVIDENKITGPIIIYCTGDMKSMVLFYVLFKIYNKNCINVLFIGDGQFNNPWKNNVREYVENICKKNYINFMASTIDISNILHRDVLRHVEMTRRKITDDLRVRLGGAVVFEADTINDRCNNIMDAILSGKQITQTNTIKPFACIDSKYIEEFANKYDVPYDVTMMDQNMTSSVNIFNEFDSVLISHYPHWRENVISHAQRTISLSTSDTPPSEIQDIEIQDIEPTNETEVDIEPTNETEVDIIMENYTRTDKFGSYYYYDKNGTSYEIFSEIIDRLAVVNKTSPPLNHIKRQWYNGENVDEQNTNWDCDLHYVFYLNDDLKIRLDILKTYLDTISTKDYINSNSILYVNLQDEAPYKILETIDLWVDYAGDIIKGIIYIEINHGRLNVMRQGYPCQW